MTDITLHEIRSGYNLAKINSNFEIIEEYINNGSLDVNAPVLYGDLDMQGNRIYNLGEPLLPTDAVRLIDLGKILGEGEAATVQYFRYIATPGQQVFNIPSGYRQGVAQVMVYLDGLKLGNGYEFEETDVNNITLFTPCLEGQIVDIHVGVFLYQANDAASVSYSPLTGPATTVQAALRAIDSSSADNVAFDVVQGNLGTRTTVGAYLRKEVGAVPVGGIIMYSGSVASIHPDWAICDGTNGTPNLVGRFIIASDTDTGGDYNIGDTGGSADSAGGTTGEHELTIAQMPPHTHQMVLTTWVGADDATGTVDGAILTAGRDYRTGLSTPTGVVLNAAGSGESHSHTLEAEAGANIPPYYALAYIMRMA